MRWSAGAFHGASSRYRAKAFLARIRKCWGEIASARAETACTRDSNYESSTTRNGLTPLRVVATFRLAVALGRARVFTKANSEIVMAFVRNPPGRAKSAALVLAGGIGLGAFEAGTYEALDAAGMGVLSSGWQGVRSAQLPPF